MRTKIKVLFYILVLVELVLSSCATSKKISGEYDDLYYRPSDNHAMQNTDKPQTRTNIASSTDNTNVIWHDTLIIQKIHWNDIKRMAKKKEIDNSQRRDLIYSHYLISINSKKLTHLESDSILRTNNDAYQKYLDSRKTIENNIKFDHIGGTFVCLIMGVTAIGILTTDDYNKMNAYETIGFVILLPTLIIGVTIEASLKSKAYKLGAEAVNIYNSGIRNNSKLPKTKISFGMMGYGIGMKINF